jgi:hypothetical protein
VRTRRLPGRREGASAPLYAILIVACLFAVPFVAAPLAAQESPQVLTGTVLRDGDPVDQATVMLHRIDSQSSGEVAVARTGPDGRFRLPLEQTPDVAFTVFFATVDYLGVRFFGRPIHPTEAARDYLIAVHDTASVLPEPIRIVRRDMVLIPESSGAWEFNEVMRIVNPTRLALTSAAGMPTWEFRIPPGATDFEAGECAFDADSGSVLPHEVSQMGDRVLLLAPVVPGARDLCIRYRVPAAPHQTGITLDSPTDTLNLFVRQPSHLTGVPGFFATRMIDADGERFLQYGATDLGAGTRVDLQWSRPGPPVDPVLAAVVVTLLLLAVGGWAAVRNRPGV